MILSILEDTSLLSQAVVASFDSPFQVSLIYSTYQLRQHSFHPQEHYKHLRDYLTFLEAYLHNPQ
jgi:hypothetical protein